ARPGRFPLVSDDAAVPPAGAGRLAAGARANRGRDRATTKHRRQRLRYARSNFSWCRTGSLLPITVLPRISSSSCRYSLLCDFSTLATSGLTRSTTSGPSTAREILFASCNISPTTVVTLFTYPAPSQVGQEEQSVRSRLCLTRLRVIATRPKSL